MEMILNKKIEIFFAIFVLIMIISCDNGTNENDVPDDHNNNDNHDNDTTEVIENSGFLFAGRVIGDFVQSHYYDIENDLIIPFGNQTSRDMVWNPTRDSVYFNYGGLGQGIWTLALEMPEMEPMLIYDSPYSEYEIMRTTQRFVFNAVSGAITLMSWDGANLDTAFYGSSGIVENFRISNDSTMFAFQYWGLQRKIYIVEILDTIPWDTLCTIAGEYYCWLDYDDDKIFVATAENGYIYSIREDADTVFVPMPQSGLKDVMNKDFQLFGVFSAGDSTEVWILEANYYIARKICSIYGNPISADISPFQEIIVVAVDRGSWDYMVKVNIDTGSKTEIAMGNTISKIRWK